MRHEGSDQVGRWPWGVWLALVGVSAGTVASFAAVGWVFLSADLYRGTDAAGPPKRAEDQVVIEAEETPVPEPGPGGSEPTTQALSAPVPEAAPVGNQAEPIPERAGEVPAEDPRLVPVEDDPECELREERPWLELESDLSDRDAMPELIIEHEAPWLPRPKE
ncbi:hypothetical protein L0U85_01380 [Glycomyces sp. L485]|uniref:hypothetical protein n=1 Tax=Glycomyces sp. L485 TaxID=2909235 RepID=UPI001F4B5740|nr:hypothetical protein [Glycomyces sp. L485]MCH7229519.1 hypothetical protein [Glycomyces sp. L485]